MPPPVDQPQLVEWGPGKTARGRARLPSSRKREKPLLSCNLCRQRKLRCDRQLPCANCTKRALGNSCTYPSSANSSSPTSGQPRGFTAAPEPSSSVQDRIMHLETLLLKLMRSQQSDASIEDNKPSETPEPKSPGLRTIGLPSPGSTSYDYDAAHAAESGATYVNSSHWAAVLNGIAELKGSLDIAGHEYDKNHRVNDETILYPTGPQLFNGCAKPSAKREILASLPTRAVTDQLVSCYFNSFEMSPAVLHSVEFLREYEEFWKDPLATPIAWIGLLFTLLCLGSEFQRHQLDPGLRIAEAISMDEHLQRTVERFRQKTVECLILADYARGGPYVLETLMLYMAIEVFLSNDAEMGICVLLGTIVQLAMHMGYHRDPTHFEGMTPFAGEMQRRVWSTVVTLDLGVSTQMGLPRLIKPWQSDVAEPLNLHDRDFGKSTTELPPGRPETDSTPMLFRLASGRIIRVLGRIWDFATDIRPYTHADVVQLDKALHDTHNSIPAAFKWDSTALSIADSPQLLLQKISLEILVLRANIVLHRRYLTAGLTSTEHKESGQKCVAAALKLLEHQRLLQEKMEPFGQLYPERWKMSPLIKNDFLLATSILCSHLKHVQNEAHDSEAPDSVVSSVREALQKAHDIWLRLSPSSKEAQKVTKALSVVLGTDTSLHPSTGAIFSGERQQSSDMPSFITPGQNAFEPRFFAGGDSLWPSWPQSEFDAIVPFSVNVNETGDVPGMIEDILDSAQWDWIN